MGKTLLEVERGPDEHPEIEVEIELTWDEPSEPPATEVAPAELPEETVGEDVPESLAAEPDESADSAVPGDADTLASLARFEVFEDRGGEWRWRLGHRNGNIIATSDEGYTTRQNAEKGMRSVMRNPPAASVQREE
jgi:uncharacterized protein YegP (UPF0339 family)